MCVERLDEIGALRCLGGVGGGEAEGVGVGDVPAGPVGGEVFERGEGVVGELSVGLGEVGGEGGEPGVVAGGGVAGVGAGVSDDVVDDVAGWRAGGVGGEGAGGSSGSSGRSRSAKEPNATWAFCSP